jgi:short-subunit dehydrogenase
MSPDPSFADRYGPWAVIAGASNGTGAAFARAVAKRGVDVVLLSRRQPVLDDVAASIRADTGVDTRVVAVDLADDDATARVIAATADLDVGMLMYNAGADPNPRPFLDGSIEFARGMLHRNCTVPMELCHHFAPGMVARGRGGIVLVSSASGLYGQATMAAYGGTKAFDIVFAEGLWTELHPQGVDVLALVLGATDTPAFRQLLAERGILADPDDPSPIPGVLSSEETVGEALDHLADGPTWMAGAQLRERLEQLGTLGRNGAVAALVAHTGVMQRGREQS